MSSTKIQFELPENLSNLYINGGWQKPDSGEMMETYNPATNEVIAEVAIANQNDIEQAVLGAQKSFVEWSGLSPLERAKFLRKAAHCLREHASELAYLDALNGGNPYQAMLGDIDFAAHRMDYFAGLATEMKGESIPMGDDGLNVILREPLGVVALVTPYNHPAMLVSGYAAAALMAGNTIVIKPCNQAPISAVRIAELFSDIFPAGVYNMLTGDGHTASQLTQHQAIAKITFIGSIPTGKKVLESAAKDIKRTTLELGGKNALIAYADADPETIADAAILGMNFAWTGGQSCGSTSRVFLHKDIYKKTLSLIQEKIKAVQPSLPTDPNCQMGCLISKQQFDKVMHYIELGKKEGATLLYGGTKPNDEALKAGYFVLPTLFADVDMSMSIAREEIFGPVMSVLSWDDEDKMLTEVNQLEYGLTASVWTTDINRALKTVKKIQSGYVWVNNVGKHFLGAPYGGYKQSGLGRTGSMHELLAYTELKNVYIALK